MRDCIGQEVNIGDEVITVDGVYAQLMVGKVVGFSTKKIRVRYVPASQQDTVPAESLRYPWQVYKK